MFSQTLFEVLKEQFLDKGISVQFDGIRTLSVSYDHNSRPYIQKILRDFSNSEDYSLLFLKQFDSSNFTIQMKHEDEPVSVLFDQVMESMDSYQEGEKYDDQLNDMMKGMCDVFDHSLVFSGNFGIGVRTINDTKRFTIKTDIVEYIEAIEKAGFEVQDNRVIIRENGSEIPVDISFRQIIQNLHSKGKSVDLQEFHQDDIVSEQQIREDSEEQDIGTTLKEDGENQERESEGPKMVKSLGEMPTSNRGVSNWLSLFFFLFVDILAIGVGIYLLMK